MPVDSGYQHSISCMLKFWFCINKDAQVYAEFRKVWFVRVIFHSWRDIPFLQAQSFEVGFLKNGAVVAVWVEFAQRSSRSSAIGPIRLRERVNKPELQNMANKLDQLELENSHNKQASQSRDVPTCLKERPSTSDISS